MSRFQVLSNLQDEIAKKFCRFQHRDKGTKLNAATQSASGNALASPRPGDGDPDSHLTIKEVVAVCRDKYSSINGAPIVRLVDENMRKEPALLAQTDTKDQVPLRIAMVSRTSPSVLLGKLTR